MTGFTLLPPLRGRWPVATFTAMCAACALFAFSACVPAKVYIYNETPRDVLVASAETPYKRISVPSEKTRAVEVNPHDRDFLVYLVSSPAGELLGCIYLALYDHSQSVTIPLSYMEPCGPQPPPDRSEPQ